MDKLSNKLLIEVYCQAKALQLDSDFIAMIEEALRQRSVLVTKPKASTVNSRQKRY